ncbi:MAG: hypothetical protein HY897_08490 [Deltaproteobacteria bacterium]|nr:hypothetical protein [Deltaproteobacteria bacterium]
MAIVTRVGLFSAVLLAVCGGTALASTDGASDRLSSARLLPDAKLRLAAIPDLVPASLLLGEQPAHGGDQEFQKKSYGVVIPLAFFAGFGSGHFYAGATWRGLKYLAYDLVALALDTAIIIFAYSQNYDTLYTWVIAGVVFGGNRIFQTIDAAQTVNAYNKGLDVSESRLGLPPLQAMTSPNDGGMPRGRMNTVYTF